MLKGLPHEGHNATGLPRNHISNRHSLRHPPLAEHHGYKGHSDLEVFAAGNIYIFEFKYTRSFREAMDQINSRDYADRYALDSRKVWHIGANLTENKDRRVLNYEIISPTPSH